MTDDRPHRFTSSPQQWRKLKPRALEMRREPTPAENALWQRLRNRQVQGAKFRRQHAIGNFIVDFACIEKRLVIEVEGAVHDNLDQIQRDLERQAIIEANGYRVVRFRNAEALNATDSVVHVIGAILTRRT